MPVIPDTWWEDCGLRLALGKKKDPIWKNKPKQKGLGLDSSGRALG
jgi:hypothetical protein